MSAYTSNAGIPHYESLIELKRLGLRRDVGAVKKIIKTLNESSIEVRSAAVNSLLSIYIKWLKVSPSKFPMRFNKIWKEQVIPILVRKVRNSDEGKVMRLYAAAVLGWMGDHRAVPMLVEGLKSRHYYSRMSSALALGMIPDFRATFALYEAVQKTNYDCQKKILSASLKSNILNIATTYVLNPILSAMTFGLTRGLIPKPCDFLSQACWCRSDFSGKSVHRNYYIHFNERKFTGGILMPPAPPSDLPPPPPWPVPNPYFGKETTQPTPAGKPMTCPWD